MQMSQEKKCASEPIRSHYVNVASRCFLQSRHRVALAVPGKKNKGNTAVMPAVQVLQPGRA